MGQQETTQQRYGVRRVFDATPLSNGGMSLCLSDRVVELGRREWELYSKLAEWWPMRRSQTEWEEGLGLRSDQIERIAAKLDDAGLLYRRADIPEALTGVEFHRRFTAVLQSWLSEAFSHPFWERMMSGNGSKRLYTGWLIELYHYTKNANRHMPLSCAHTREKPIKAMRAQHYAEEWNHYHYFMKALKALGYTEQAIGQSVPLPVTLALSNFMRQAAREDVLAYSICSAVLEGTTTDRRSYDSYYAKTAELYGVPPDAVDPIYAHLDLDVQYRHSDLFLEILRTVDTIPSARAGRILDYGHQLVEHIWLWTDGIEKYYEDETSPLPRRPFDPFID